jgi:Tol biopolymer transport system component
VSTGDGEPANDDSNTPSISGDGRYVTFTSLADNLVANDGNMDRDVFVYDRVNGTTELASKASDGTHGNFASGGLGAGPARISNDGRYVVFGSFADNLVASDMNAKDDIFVRDRTMNITERVSIATNGTEGDGHSVYGSISDDGRYAVWWSDSTTLVPDEGNPATDAFLRYRMTSTTTLLSAVPGGWADPDGASRFPVISADGAFVAFQSAATNLVTPDTNASTDVLLLRLADSQLTRIAYGDGDSTLPAINADGSAVAFQSLAPDLAPGDGDTISDVFAWGKALAPPTPTHTATATATRTPTPQPYPTGDADCSRAADAIDATRVLQLAAGLVDTLPCLLQGDANADLQVNAVDALLILQYVVGLLDQLPPG